MFNRTQQFLIQQDLPDEIWLPVVNYETLYEVSNMGRVRTLTKSKSHNAGYILSNRKIPQGYCYVALSLDGHRKKFYVHRLVLMAFNPTEDYEKMDANHINGQRDDNRLENLEWLSHADNLRYSMHVLKTFRGYRPSDPPKKVRVLKGHKKGEAQSAAKLNADKVREIRRLCDTGMKQCKIAEMFGVSNGVIGQIKKRKAWAHID